MTSNVNEGAKAGRGGVSVRGVFEPDCRRSIYEFLDGTWGGAVQILTVPS